MALPYRYYDFEKELSDLSELLQCDISITLIKRRPWWEFWK